MLFGFLDGGLVEMLRSSDEGGDLTDAEAERNYLTNDELADCIYVSALTTRIIRMARFSFIVTLLRMCLLLNRKLFVLKSGSSSG